MRTLSVVSMDAYLASFLVAVFLSIGQRKTVFVRFKNVVPVPVEWRLRDNPLDKSKKKSGGLPHSVHKNFAVEPRQASLAPGKNGVYIRPENPSQPSPPRYQRRPAACLSQTKRIR